ncbi:MAG: aspartate aminotransferase family protein, partial [Dongiaceae bacterium]
LVAAVELVRDKAPRASLEPKLGVGPYLVRRAQEHGLLVRPLADSIAFCPPLIITEEQISDLTARFGRALDDTMAWVGEQGLAAVA